MSKIEKIEVNGTEYDVGGAASYNELSDKPIYVTQTVYENDQSGTQGMLFGQTIYKIADTMVTLAQLIGGKVNGETMLTNSNVMDISSTLAQTGFSGNCVAFSPRNFNIQPPNYDFAILSLDAVLSVPAYYTNIPSAGMWALASVTELALKADVDIDEKYASFLLPEQAAENNGQAVQVQQDGTWAAGAQVPIVGCASWREIRRNVKLGRGAALYPVHTVFNVRHKKFGSIPFEVVAHDVDADPNNAGTHTMTLLMLEGLFRGSQSYAFDEREKLCNCPGGLAAGSYYADIEAINAAKNGGSGGVSGEVYGFTLTQAVPSGGYLAFDIDYYNTWSPITITSYASAGTIVETVAVTADDSSGTDIMTALSLSDINYGGCARYGSSNYKQSAIKQWLNASGSGWWTAKTVFDLPPDYVDDDGFLGGLDPDFARLLLETEQVTSTSKNYEEIEAVNSSYTITDKVFLASYTQVGGEAINQQAAENTLWPAFTGLSAGAEPARVKYRHGLRTEDDADSSCWWWLRSPNPANPDFARRVYTDGRTNSNGNAYFRYGAVAAACVI